MSSLGSLFLLFFCVFSSVSFIIPVLTPPCPDDHIKCKDIGNCPRVPDCKKPPAIHMKPFQPSKHIIVAMKICPRGYYGEGCRLKRTTASTTSISPATVIVTSTSRPRPILPSRPKTLTITWSAFASVSIILGVIITRKCFCGSTSPETTDNVMYFENPVYSLPCSSLAETVL